MKYMQRLDLILDRYIILYTDIIIYIYLYQYICMYIVICKKYNLVGERLGDWEGEKLGFMVG